jgi:hypothetical protein
LVLIAGCSSEKNSGSDTPENKPEPLAGTPVNPPQTTTETQNENQNKNNDVENLLKAGEMIASLADDAIESKRVKDSIRLANKEKMFAYQIGFEITDKDELFKTYNKLTEAGVSNLYALKQGKEDFILVKYEAKSETELRDSLNSFKQTIAGVHSEKIEVINLMSKCDKKEIVKKGENISKRKEDYEIPCLICD